MYLRAVFTETDPARIAALITRNPFGVLVTHSGRGLEATHIPFALRPEAEGFVLTGHLAAANPQCDMLDGGEGMAIFTGPHAYVSPGWYQTQPAVPTWDYTAIHVTGRLAVLTEPGDVIRDIQAMAIHDPTGFDMALMEPGYRARMMAGIRAFTLRPKKIEAQWKMSQNRSLEDRSRVIAALRAQADPMSSAVASLIAETMPAES